MLKNEASSIIRFFGFLCRSLYSIMTNILSGLLTTTLFSVLFSGCQHEASKKEVIEENPKDTTALFIELKAYDSLLFDIGFNECNIAVFDSLVADDFEFYHDQSGIISSKQNFIDGTKNGLCNMDYKAVRKLKSGSQSVFPMYNNGELYGALQTGFHRFYARYPNSPELQLTSEAHFSHIWLKDSSHWKLSRVISYDHVSPCQE